MSMRSRAQLFDRDLSGTDGKGMKDDLFGGLGALETL